mmetsp:Transcript_10138/g.33785  ORF Transcript_10138/g.33785 Transcript_10138/m.33785 type:complete len:404 (+) Transcript_10138:423-1634(+)
MAAVSIVRARGAAMSERGRTRAFLVMEVMREALAKDPKETIHLEVGQPSSPAPRKVREAASAALQGEEKLGYTEAAGVRELREKIAGHYKTSYGVEVDAGSVLVTTGSSGAFIVAFTGAFDHGDRVAMASPGYPCYRNILEALGVEVVELPVGEETNWQPTRAMLEEAMKGGKIHGLILASPSNPTGTILRSSEMQDLCSCCSTHGIRLISDEIYHGIIMEGRADSALQFKKDAVIINSFSKYYSMTGWRLGWIVCQDPQLAQSFENLLQNFFISAPTLSQLAGIAAFDCIDELEQHVERYKKNREVLLNGLPKAGFHELSRPQGAFYIYAHVKHMLGPAGCKDSMELAKKILADCSVAVTPGLDFDLSRGGEFIRFSFAGATQDMERACEKLQRWYEGLEKK